MQKPTFSFDDLIFLQTTEKLILSPELDNELYDMWNFPHT